MKSEKNSDSRERWYDDACGMAFGMEIIGERWTLIIMRELLYGACRFGALRRAIPGLSASVLTQRLERLEAIGALVRRTLPPPASVPVYELTDWGRESETMMAALGRWAVRSPIHDPRLPLSVAALIMSFRTNLDAGQATGIDARIAFAIGADRFGLHLHDGMIEASRGEMLDAVLRFTASDPGAIAAVLYGGAPLIDPGGNGAVLVDGDRALAERFVALFPLPSKTG